MSERVDYFLLSQWRPSVIHLSYSDSKSRLNKLLMEDVMLFHLPTVFPEANFTAEFILFSSERSDGFTSNGLVGLVWSSRKLIVKIQDIVFELVNS